MRLINYTDADGRIWAVQLPDGLPDSDASLGLPVGPPSLSPLGLPLEVEVRLHNQLYHRRIFSLVDAQRNRQNVVAALLAAMKLDAERIIQLYAKEVQTDGVEVTALARPAKAPKERKARVASPPAKRTRAHRGGEAQ